MKSYLQEILNLIGPDRGKLPGLFLLFIASSFLDLLGLGLIGPYITLVADPQALDGTLGEFVSFLGLPREQQSLLIALGGTLIVVFMLKAAAAIGINRSIIRFGLNQQARLRSVLMDAYQHLPFTEFLRRNSSEYVYTIQQLTQVFSGGVVIPGLRTLSDGVVALAILGLLVWQNALALAMLAVLMGTMVYAYDRLFRRNLRAYGEQANQAATTMVQGVHEGIEGLKEIRILGKEAYFHRVVQQCAKDYSSLSTLSQVISAAPRFLLEVILVIFIVMLVHVSLIIREDLSSLIPTLGVFGLAGLRLLPSATGLSANVLQLRFNRNAVFRLHSDLEAVSQLRPEQLTNAQTDVLQPFETLTLDRIRFTYPNASQAALDNLSLEICTGDSIGIVGPSGSGKTTLVDVILGLLEPQAGAMSYNHRPLQDAMGEWRARVAYLPQQVFLIDNTLACNVALGEEEADIDEGRLNEALRQARLGELVHQLPQGVDTLLGERGVRLSGGQRQRVALARAFYHGREVLVMDEATSALDNETEQEIVNEIRRLKGRKTMIVIAHRLTTVQHCDRIYQLELGRIVDVGTPDEILKEPKLRTS